MSTLRPNANVSPVTERFYGIGLGMFLAALIIGEGNSTRSAIVALVGAVIVVSSMIAIIIVKRRQIAASRQENVKVLK